MSALLQHHHTVNYHALAACSLRQAATRSRTAIGRRPSLCGLGPPCVYRSLPELSTGIDRHSQTACQGVRATGRLRHRTPTAPARSTLPYLVLVILTIASESSLPPRTLRQPKEAGWRAYIVIMKRRFDAVAAGTSGKQPVLRLVLYGVMFADILSC